MLAAQVNVKGLGKRKNEQLGIPLGESLISPKHRLILCLHLTR